MPPHEMPYTRAAFARDQVRQLAFSTLIGGLLMCFIGFYLNPRGFGASQLYIASVAVFTLTMKIGGCAMLAMAGLCYAGWRPAALLDAVLAGAIGVLLAAIGIIWFSRGNVEGLLLLIFSLLFLHSARQSWLTFRMTGDAGWPGPAVETATEEEASPAVDPDRAATSTEALRRAVRQRGKPGAEQPAETGSMREPAVPPVPPPVEAVRPIHEEADDEPSPEGFLADLGRNDDE